MLIDYLNSTEYLYIRLNLKELKSKESIMLRIYNHYISRTVFLLFSTEMLALMMVFYISAFLRFPDDDEMSVSYETFAHFLPEATTFTSLS